MTDQQKIAIGVLAALIVAMIAALLVTGGDDAPSTAVAIDSITTSSSATTSSTEVTTSTSFAPVTTTASVVDATTTSTSTTTTGPETTTTEVVDDLNCTQISSLTANGLSGELCQEGTGVVGRPMRLHLVARDGDARVRDDCGSPIFHWGDDDESVVCEIGCSPSSQPTQPSQIDVRRDHSYEQPGSYDVSVEVESNCGEGLTGERQVFELVVGIRGD